MPKEDFNRLIKDAHRVSLARNKMLSLVVLALALTLSLGTVLGNPYKYIDPFGMDPTPLDEETNAAFAQFSELAEYALALKIIQEQTQKKRRRNTTTRSNSRPVSKDNRPGRETT